MTNPTKPITQKEWQEMTSNIVILPELRELKKLQEKGGENANRL